MKYLDMYQYASTFMSGSGQVFQEWYIAYYNTCLDNKYIWSTVQVMYQYVWLPTIQWDILNGDVQHTEDLNI